MNTQENPFKEIVNYIIPATIIGTIGYFFIQTAKASSEKTELVFSIYDINGNEISFVDDNEKIFIRGNAVINGIYKNNNIFIFDSKTKTNLGYGLTDIFGNFDKIYGIELDTENMDILCIIYR